MIGEIVFEFVEAAGPLLVASIAAILLFAGMLSLAVTRWALNQGARAVGSLFLVGGALAGAMFNLRDRLYYLHVDWAQLFTAQVFVIIRGYVVMLRVATMPIRIWTAGGLTNHQEQISAIGRTVDLELRPRELHQGEEIEALNRTVINRLQPNIQTLFEHTDLLRADFTVAKDEIEALNRTVINRLEPGIQTLYDRTDALRRDLERVLPYLPLLAQLATFPGGVVGTLDRDAQQLGRLEGAASNVRADLERVLPLSVITALGAVAVANLARVARDPCNPCGDIDLNNQESRIEALEGIGA